MNEDELAALCKAQIQMLEHWVVLRYFDTGWTGWMNDQIHEDRDRRFVKNKSLLFYFVFCLFVLQTTTGRIWSNPVLGRPPKKNQNERNDDDKTYLFGLTRSLALHAAAHPSTYLFGHPSIAFSPYLRGDSHAETPKSFRSPTPKSFRHHPQKALFPY